MVAPTKKLIDAIDRDKVRWAREMTIEQKLAAAGELFDSVCERMRAGIRWQFPDADETRVEEILRERLNIARRLERMP